MSKAEMARTILKTTPGVVADAIFDMHGVTIHHIRHCGLKVRRINKFGWALA